MTITVRRSGPDDRPAILALLQAARGEGLSPAERAERGFVQGAMDDQVLTRFQEGTGVFVAEEDGALAGFAMTSLPGAVSSGPPKLAVDAVTDGAQAPGRPFLYGPAAVDPRFQGRGVLTAMLTALCRELRSEFDRGVAFVEAANEKSLAVHRHYGMTEAARFHHADRQYLVFTFDPTAFAEPRTT